MRLRHVLVGVTAVAVTSLGLLAALPASAEQPVAADPTVSPEPTETPVAQCDAADVPVTDAPALAGFGTASTGRFTGAQLHLAPRETIVLTIDLATGKIVANKSDAIFDKAGSYETKFQTTRDGLAIDIYFKKMPVGFCDPEVTGPNNKKPVVQKAIGTVPEGMDGISVGEPGRTGNLTIKWVQTR